MKTKDFRFGTRLFAFLCAISIVALLIIPSATSSTETPQGRGGEVVTKPTPAPKKTPPPKRSSPPVVTKSPPNFRPTNPHIELVRIQPGHFLMGSSKGEPDETPVIPVTIGYPFFMGKYEVTKAQWQAVMGTSLSSFNKRCGGNCPVEGVDWEDAQKFIKRLNEINDGYTYRLPSEAEWEYACRAGTAGDYAGNLDDLAWYGYDSRKTSRRVPGAQPVGGKKPNAWGLYDMHGNLWEWCQDWYHDNYRLAPKDGRAWVKDRDVDGGRVMRGGSWISSAERVRSAARYPGENNPDLRPFEIGFRVVAVART